MVNTGKTTTENSVRKKKSFRSKLFFGLYSLAFSSLLLSYLAPYVSPQTFWPLAFFGLGYPIILIVNMLFMIWWALRWKRTFFIPFTAILIGWNQLGGLFQVNLVPTEDSKDKIKIMSWNVHLFDLYNWKYNEKTRNKIFELIKSETPDVICLQEIFVDDSRKFVTLDTLGQIQPAKNLHVEFTTTLNRVHHWGICTYSKYPIVNKGKIEFHTDANNSCIYTDLKIGNDTIRVYNMHLQSILFRKEDYTFIDNVIKNKETDELQSSKRILRRLKRAFLKRSVQVDLVMSHINECPYPMIVCGDFNEIPSSYTYQEFTSKLTDSFSQSGYGLGKTYNGTFPFLRIDYILHSNIFSSSDYQTLRDTLSDHFPITCNLVKKK